MNAYETVNCVGIDVSKGKSTIAIMRPLGEIVQSPHEVKHTLSDLKALETTLRQLEGETRIVMEYTGKYYQPVARFLNNAGYDGFFSLRISHSCHLLSTEHWLQPPVTDCTIVFRIKPVQCPR